MSILRIISEPTQQTGRTWNLTTVALTDAGAREAGHDLTAAVYNSVTGKWWNASTTSWEVGREDIAMSADANVTGLHVLALDPTVLLGVNTEGDLFVEVLSGVLVPAMQVAHLRYSVVSFPVVDRVIPDQVTQGTHLWSLLTAWFGNRFVMNDADKELQLMRLDGETPAITFKTFDAAGRPSCREVFTRERP